MSNEVDHPSYSMFNEFIRILLDAGNRCGELFVLRESEGGSRPRPKAWAKIPHAEWIPQQVMDYGLQLNGCVVEWVSPDDDSGRPKAVGRFQLLTLDDIYSDWSKELGLHHEPADSRLHHFKVVDLAYTDVCVGLYHDEAQDPGLYVFRPASGEQPYPLYLDLLGYARLLTKSLGYQNWQIALLQLLPDDGINIGHRLEPEYPELREMMSAWVPEFDYEAFVAQYQELQLRNYTPSGLATSSSST
ncbi:hypothetical protein EJV47_22875 [Hymenobacter gummosus]|uniref:Uncharacterized protein n=1 Tax=Hymenobacter gummosus TaxID=1776032 RepID=A0A431TWM4_9BACT|nr:hypothetical protein [Hymenobacter gummosus]RTQ46006.1 hypothetical protein EJV47_22875 [Hymenobacter gummosus]